LHETGTVVVTSTETRQPHEAAIRKAREACARSGHTVADHFVDINEMVGIAGAQRAIEGSPVSAFGSL
jgi:hypothetical protein